MTIPLLEEIFTSLTNPLLASITTTSSRVAASITPTATILLMLYICLWSWALIRGQIQEPILDFVGRMVKFSFIYSIALLGVHYSTFIIDFFWKTPDAIASVIISDPRMSTPNASMKFLDDFFMLYHDYAGIWFSAAEKNSYIEIPKLSQFFVGFSITIVGIINTAIAAFFLLLAKVALAILLGIGPIFIISIYFESTRKLFDAWVGQVLNYVFVFALIATTMSIVGVEVFNQIHKAYSLACLSPPNCTTEPDFSQAMMIIILSAISIFFYFIVPGIASALGGGVALHSMGAVGWAYRKASAVAGGLAREVSGRGMQERAMRRMQITQARNWAKNNPTTTRRVMNATGQGIKKVFTRGNTVKKA